MDWSVFVKAIDGAMRETKVDVFVLAGFGEPLLYPKLEEAIRYIKERNPAAKVCLTSNGTLLGAEVGHRLAEAGLTQITVSVNATSAEQYQRINSSNSYAKIVENTKEFLRAINESGKDILVLIQVLGGVNDEAQIQKFRDFWAPHLGRCGAIQVQPFINWAGQIDSQSILDHESAAREAERSAGGDIGCARPSDASSATLPGGGGKDDNKKDGYPPFAQDGARQEVYPCYHLHSSRMISREGNALACCMVAPDEQGDLALGNILDCSFEELYLSGKILKLRRENLNGNLRRYSPCNKCNAWKTVPNIWWYNPLHRWIGTRWW